MNTAPNSAAARRPVPRRLGQGLLVLLATAGLWSCATRQPAPGDQGAADGDTSLRTFMAGLVPAGWGLSDEVLEFTPENLYEQINGRAELFLAYNVVDLTYADFEHRTDAMKFINLSVYDMGTATNAFGVFSVERMPGDSPIDLGRAAYCSDANCYVWQGQYYVQVIASDITDDCKRITVEMARRVADFLTDTGDPVWGLAALPQTDRVPQSVRYFQVDAFGLDFMQHTYTAQYRRGDAVIDAFLSPRESADAAQRVVTQYAAYAEKYGKGAERLTDAAEGLVVCDMGGNVDVVFQKGRQVAGVTAVADRALAIEAATDFYRQLGEG